MTAALLLGAAFSMPCLAKAKATADHEFFASCADVLGALPESVQSLNWKIDGKNSQGDEIRFKTGAWHSNVEGNIVLVSASKRLCAMHITAWPQSGAWLRPQVLVQKDLDKQAPKLFEAIASRVHEHKDPDFSGIASQDGMRANERQEQIKIYATMERLRSRILDDFVSDDWKLTTDTPHQLGFYKDLAANRGIIDYLLFGEALPKAHRVSVAFNLIPMGNEVKVVATSELYTQNGYGQVAVADTTKDPTMKVQLSNYLQHAKTEIEKDILSAQ